MADAADIDAAGDDPKKGFFFADYYKKNSIVLGLMATTASLAFDCHQSITVGVWFFKDFARTLQGSLHRVARAMDSG